MTLTLYHRTVIVQAFWSGESMASLANAFGVPIARIEAVVRQALKKADATNGR